MGANFRVVGLARELFLPLFALEDEALRERGIRRRVVEEEGATPCRVSLEDAAPGERVLLLPFTHHDVGSPYRASRPIYVREAAATAQPLPGEVPPMLLRRLLSVRAYDADAMLVDADVLPGTALAARVDRWFADARIAYLHVHNARPGCFNCRIDRL